MACKYNFLSSVSSRTSCAQRWTCSRGITTRRIRRKNRNCLLQQHQQRVAASRLQRVHTTLAQMMRHAFEICKIAFSSGSRGLSWRLLLNYYYYLSLYYSQNQKAIAAGGGSARDVLKLIEHTFSDFLHSTIGRNYIVSPIDYVRPDSRTHRS